MNGTYGTIKPANINIDTDVQIFYNYKPNRSYENSRSFQELPANNLLKATDGNNVNIDGLYNLKLPLSVFGNKGIYTIYIKPKELNCTIYTTGVLQDYPDVRGVIFQANEFDSYLTTNNGLVGYRIEYTSDDSDNTYTRLITSSNMCDVIPSNGQSKFRLYDTTGDAGSSNGRLIFCTVTPSSSNSFTPLSIPSIGAAGESVKVVNTKFNPIMFEIEMVDHDAETLSYMLEGEQVRNLENGTFTVYNHDKEIYKQYEAYTVKTHLGRPLYDIKAKKDVIDASQNYNNTIASN